MPPPQEFFSQKFIHFGGVTRPLEINLTSTCSVQSLHNSEKKIGKFWTTVDRFETTLGQFERYLVIPVMTTLSTSSPALLRKAASGDLPGTLVIVDIIITTLLPWVSVTLHHDHPLPHHFDHRHRRQHLTGHLLVDGALVQGLKVWGDECLHLRQLGRASVRGRRKNRLWSPYSDLFNFV